MVTSFYELYPVLITLKVAIASTLLCFLAGMPVAYFLAKKSFAGKSIAEAIIMQPLVIPPTVLGYYLLVIFGSRSFVGRFLSEKLGISIVFTVKGAVLAAFIASLPLFVITSRAAIESVDRNLENAARLLGKNELEVFFSITLPLSLRGVIAGMIMSFARATGEFGATLMVAGNIPLKTQTAAIAIYDAVQSNNIALANKLVAIMTIASFVLLIIFNKINKRAFAYA